MADIKPEDIKIEIYDANKQPIGQTVMPYDERPFKARVTYIPTGVYYTAESHKSLYHAKSEALKALHADLDFVEKKAALEALDWAEVDGA